jgi:hypothetical protein
MKYKQFVYIDNNGDVNRDYRLVGAFQVDNSYFELSENSNQNNSINTDLLRGAPYLPLLWQSVCICSLPMWKLTLYWRMKK